MLRFSVFRNLAASVGSSTPAFVVRFPEEHSRNIRTSDARDQGTVKVVVPL